MAVVTGGWRLAGASRAHDGRRPHAPDARTSSNCSSRSRSSTIWPKPPAAASPAGIGCCACFTSRPARARRRPDAVDARRIARCRWRFATFGSPIRTAPAPVLRTASICASSPATLTVLVGASGAGKSTLLSLLVRLFDPDPREHPARRPPASDRFACASLREQFAILSQDTHLFAGTIRSVLWRRAIGRRRWRACGRRLQLVSLDASSASSREQLDTPLGEDGVNLSGGQRRRLALARAFLLRRPILLLDEPLANVDAESAAVILDAIDELRGPALALPSPTTRRSSERPIACCRLVDGRLVERADCNRSAALSGRAR